MNRLKKERKVRSKRKSGFVRGVNKVLSGSYLTREYVQANLPFILFVVVMMVGYIAYGYYAEKNVKAVVEAEQQLRELKARNTAVEAHLEKLKQQSQVSENISELGLLESTAPPVVLRPSAQNTHAN
jgi:cell division protein FtsB